VQLARAQIAALRTAGDPEGRYRAKWKLVRGLYHEGYSVDEVRELFRLIDWMMHLRDDLDDRFQDELIALEERLETPHLTSLERRWMARGEARGEAMGEVKGRAELLLTLFRKLHGTVPQEVEARIRNLSRDRLETLGEAVLDLKSIPELEAWLDSAEKPAG
jgi:hypothetical protein